MLESGKGITIANKLVNTDKILFVDEVNGKRVYQAPMATGGRDLQEIEKLKFTSPPVPARLPDDGRTCPEPH